MPKCLGGMTIQYLKGCFSHHRMEGCIISTFIKREPIEPYLRTGMNCTTQITLQALI
uniref:Uncharacterized protein n=1 Tax=Arundo donax TaxID=35708 RepID=A0A0A8ZR70_ARUDO